VGAPLSRNRVYLQHAVECAKWAILGASVVGLFPKDAEANCCEGGVVELNKDEDDCHNTAADGVNW
jgi:hypothetical protein